MNNVRHLYTEWEENPDKMILRSKSCVTLLPFASSAEDSGMAGGSKLSFTADSEEESVTPGGEGVLSTVIQTDSGFLSVPESSISGGSGLDDDDTSSHDESSCSKHESCDVDKESSTKYSPEQLQTIQARVKDSLKNQGVYLYDPVTGAGKLWLLTRKQPLLSPAV